MTVSEFCKQRAEPSELIVIRDKGTIKGSVWINERGTSLVPMQYTNDYIRKESWGNLVVIDQDGQKKETPCHFLDV